MKHLQKFTEYEKVDEGFKDWIAGALLLLSTTTSSYGQFTPKFGIKDIDSKNYTSTIRKEYGEKDSIQKEKDEKMFLKAGWKQIATNIDTLLDEVSKKSPDTSSYTISLKFDNKVLFESGRFNISKEVGNEIDSAFQQMVDQGGVLVNIDIVSSTDKMPVGVNLQKTLKDMGLSPDNTGLSKARSSAIKKYITNGVNVDGVKEEINDSLITVNNLVEEGGFDDQTARYVYVNISFLKTIKVAEDVAEDDYKTKTTVYYQKDFKKHNKKVHFSLNGLFKVFGHGKVHKGGGRLKCPKW